MANLPAAGFTFTCCTVQPFHGTNKAWLTFTDDGCRTELRIGALLVLVAVFVWLWLGPDIASRLALVGLPLLLVGGALQFVMPLEGVLVIPPN